MYKGIPDRSDAPALLLMAAMFLSLGLYAIVRPGALRTAMDNLTDAWEPDGWHPCKMSEPAVRVVVGGVGVLCAVLFAYIAYVALSG